MAMIGAATGLGITTNVVQCYAALIRMYEPGDRIFLFGFSRGAYTVRLLSGVLAKCGVPYRTEDGKRVARDQKGAESLAYHAVTKIYQHMESLDVNAVGPRAPTVRQREFLDQRRLLGEAFRRKYNADAPDGSPEAKPHFIGVFDTVSSLFNVIFLLVLAFIAIVALLGLTHVISYFLSISGREAGFYVFGFPAIVALAQFIRCHLKFPGRIEDTAGGKTYPWWRTWRFSAWRMNFDDNTLSSAVGTARHALSIDERRYAFDCVPWSLASDEELGDKPDGWFEQTWFAGVHSDIGGGYENNEARLSDVSLRWMVDAAKGQQLIINENLLHLYPDPLGPQHDELPNTLLRIMGPLHRKICRDAPLHDSVLTRLAAKEVQHHDGTRPYDPQSLRKVLDR